jgi:hypothetical protein
VYHWGCVGFASLAYLKAGGVESASLEGHPMAWLEQHPTSGRFKICFRFGGRQLKKTVKVTERQQAEATPLFRSGFNLTE